MFTTDDKIITANKIITYEFTTLRNLTVYIIKNKFIFIATWLSNLQIFTFQGRKIDYVSSKIRAVPTLTPEEKEKIPQQQNDYLLISGFVDSWKENEQYIELVKKLNLDGLDLQQLSDSITQDMQI